MRFELTQLPERSSAFYARIAGFIYLLAMTLSIVNQSIVLGGIIEPDDAAATARNIVSAEGRFRLGIAIDIVTFMSDVVIGWAFYELLKAVDSSLALLGAFLRIANAAILAVVTLNALITLKVLSGVEYLHAFDEGQLEGLARLYLSARGIGLYIGFVFLGTGSAVFAYVLFKSRYVPRVLSGWGIFASALLALGSLGVLLFPWFAANASIAYMVPMFFYEVPLGLWLLFAGVRTPPSISSVI